MRLQLEGFDVICRKSDGFVNVTAICNAHNSTATRGKKDYYEWIRSKDTRDFVIELFCDLQNINREELRLRVIRDMSVPGIPGTEGDAAMMKIQHTRMFDMAKDTLIKSVQGGIPSRQGTWAHPQLAIAVAQWVSPKFAVRVSKWIHELLVTGSVRLGMERSTDAIMAEQLRQLREENDTLILKNSSLEDKIQELMAKMDSLQLETRAQTAIIGSMHGELTNANGRLCQGQEGLHDTHSLVADLSERAVPIIEDLTKLEVFMLFRVWETINGHLLTRYHMKGVQRKGVSAAKSAVKKRYGAGCYLLLHTWYDTPSARKLKQKIREMMGDKLEMSNNDIVPLVRITDEDMISCIEEIYRQRIEA